MNTIRYRLILSLIVASLLFPIQEVASQVNRSGLKNNYSKTGKSVAVIRHGITAQLGVGISPAAFIGIGYNASQYYGIGNRFMQQSITYQIGLNLGNTDYQSSLIHNITASFHCSYIGTADLSPMIYGVTMHFAAAKDSRVYQNPNDINSQKGEFMSNIYLRPEIGLTFPTKYSRKTKERVPFTFSLTYGYNIGLFMKRMELIAEEMEEQGIEKSAYPWTSLNHHFVTLRFNFNFVHYREFQ